MPTSSAGARFGRTRTVRSGAVIVAHAVLLRKSGAEGRDGHDPIAFGEAHDDHAAGVRRVAVDRVGLGPDDLAVGRDEEQFLVLIGDLLDRRDITGLAALEADEPDALAAAVLLA